ncbi:G-protein coupled receptor Mth2-like [Thrips palmi]|uniref:G-protein coupled receptor Mth2-like n=1 Tax=Thrips palmi TaxID=161013 RepID=A0A6P9A4T5_THRPL|nr:G-protein coupled receptor Mth2-like [Thrips palmi]
MGCACKAGTCFFKCCPAGEMSLKQRRCGTAAERESQRGAVLSGESPCGLARAAAEACGGNATAEPDADLDAPGLDNVTLALDLYSVDNLEEPWQSAVPPPPQWIMLYGKPSRPMLRLEPNDADDKFYLLANGSLFVPGHSTTAFPPAEFCMDVFDDVGTVTALIPFPPETDEVVDHTLLYDTVNSVGLLISLPFLMTTFIVYASLGELQNLHGKSLLCHVGAMTLAFVDLLLVKFRIGADNLMFCKFLGFFLQFAFLACFFWLNVMCFDIWWTFSGFRSVHGSPSWSAGERSRFRAYSLYAWGGPLVILVVTVTVQVVGDCVGLPAYVIHPGVGVDSCYLGSTHAKYAYFRGPAAVLLLCNVGLFVHTAIRIVQLRRETRALKGAESKRHSDERHRYFVYLKLFVTMGVNWIAEIVSGMLPEPERADYGYLGIVIIVSDVTNSLQGILIFVMCVGTGHVRGLVVDRILRRRPARQVSSHSSTKTTNTRANGVVSRSNGDSIKKDVGLFAVKPVAVVAPNKSFVSPIVSVEKYYKSPCSTNSIEATFTTV